MHRQTSHHRLLSHARRALAAWLCVALLTTWAGPVFALIAAGDHVGSPFLVDIQHCVTDGQATRTVEIPLLAGMTTAADSDPASCPSCAQCPGCATHKKTADTLEPPRSTSWQPLARTSRFEVAPALPGPDLLTYRPPARAPPLV